MDISAGQRRRDFSIWIRTGRWPRRGESPRLELKFNPWHDPSNGRFTFAGAGDYSGPGGAGRAGDKRQDAHKVKYVEDATLPRISSREEVETWRAAELAKHGREPGYPDAIEAQYRRYLAELASQRATPGSQVDVASQVEGGFSASTGEPSAVKGRARASTSAKTAAPRRAKTELRANPAPPSHREVRSPARGEFDGGGGSFGGGGASGSWEPPTSQSGPPVPAGSSTSEPRRIRPSESANVPAVRPGATPSEQRHTVVRNGYTYELDARGRTRRVSGTLSDTDKPVRSRANQAQAGGAHRRPNDDGGHYVAARFNGPTDAFNHFAQDANFNRGRYRALEDQWASAKRADKKVTVEIVPHYHEGSRRPYELDVTFTINGRVHSIRLPNEKTEKSNAKR